MKQLFFISLFLCPTLSWGYGNFAPLQNGSRFLNPNETFLSSETQSEQNAIKNLYAGSPGCYILCLGPPGGLYKVTDIYALHGLIRIEGHYPTNSPTNERSKRNCYPNGLKGAFSPFTYYKDLCNQSFPNCHDKCLGSPDTGGFYTRTPIKP